MDSEPAPNHAVVRRHTPTDAQPPAPFTASPPPPRRHESPVFEVQTDVVWPTITADGQLKGPPHLQLRWEFKPKQRGRIVGFRRRDGFGSAGNYGEMIVNSRISDAKPEHLEPGEYFYNFFTRKSVLGLFHVYDNDVQFSETVPSIENVLTSMKQAVRFTKLKQKFVELSAPPPTPEDPLAVWLRDFEKGMASMDVRCEAAVRFLKQWEERKKLIADDPDLTAKEKRKQREMLDGIMRGFREKFEV